jgi:HSP20 family protein
MNLIPRNQNSGFDSIFDDFFTGLPLVVGRKSTTDPLNAMRVDIHETATQYAIVADLPGFKKDDISVTVADDVLTISAAASTETEEKESGRVIRRERTRGSYSRSFAVSQGIKQDKINAHFEDGVLHLTVPKLTEEDIQADVRKITIN